MTRAQRRSKTARIKWWRKRGYTYRQGRFWQRWRWTARVPVWCLPVLHEDYEAIRGELPRFV